MRSVHMRIDRLTAEQRAWFKDNYADTRNAELAAKLGIATRSCVRLARQLGVCKSASFIAAMQRHASACGAEITRGVGNAGMANLQKGAAYRFKPGFSQKDCMSAEAFADLHRRIGESLKETFRKERLRVKWGFEQKTSLRVVQCSRAKIKLRCALRKRGYQVARMSNDVYYDCDTRRSARLEASALRLKMTLTDMTW